MSISSLQVAATLAGIMPLLASQNSASTSSTFDSPTKPYPFPKSPSAMETMGSPVVSGVAKNGVGDVGVTRGNSGGVGSQSSQSTTENFDLETISLISALSDLGSPQRLKSPTRKYVLGLSALW